MGDKRAEHNRRPPFDSSSVALLSCELCSKRKIRCDKQQPCSACVKAGKECSPVVRPRLPRGRRGGRKEANTELQARVRRLENLVLSLSGNSASSPPKSTGVSPVSPPQSTSIADGPDVAAQPSIAALASPNNLDISRLLGSTVWTQLSSELSGLRYVLENDDEDDPEMNSPNQPTSRDDNSSSVDSPLNFGPQDAVPIDVISSDTMKDLMSVFAYRVDPVMKIVHLPTFQHSLESGSVYLGHDVNSSAFELLRSAAFYVAFCSLAEAECLTQFGEKKDVAQGRWQSVAEYWLRKADITNNQNIVILQGLLLYIAGVRSHDNGPRSWTLMGLAVRIAHGLQLHREEAYQSLTFFHAQLHRRVWYCLLGLDFQASFDRGTDPVAPPNSYNTKVPLNLNDADLGSTKMMTLSEESGITDMTFMMIAAEGQLLIRQLSFIPAGDSEQPPTTMQYSWESRQQSVTNFKERITSKYLDKLDTTIPLQFASWYLGQVILSAMQLYVTRPLQRHPGASPPPPGAVNVLLRATETLERKEMFKNAVTTPWHWLFAGYVDWHPLATLLAELCAPQNDLQLVQRAWRAADVAYAAVAQRIAEGTHGPLWKPLKKLMKMAQRRRALEQPQSYTDTERSLSTVDMMDFGAQPSGLDTSMSVLDASLPTDYGFGIDPLDDSWMNWQGFVDDVAQNSYIGWTTNLAPFDSDLSSGTWNVPP